MKKLVIVFITSIILITTSFSQPCLPEGITFTTQSEIDNFQSNYPGCTEIEGNVTINDYVRDFINDLSGLSVLTNIGGNLYIDGVIFLKSLNGLNNLTKVDGYVEINFNDSLVSMSGLESLNFIGGNLILWGNNSLLNLEGLNALDSIGGNMRLGLNSLSNLSGLDNLKSIGNDLIIENNSLSEVTGIESLTSVGGDIRISNNSPLSSLTGLENINASSIHNLSIYNNSWLSSCSIENICEYLISPNGTLAVFNNYDGCNSPSEISDECGITLPCLPYGNYYFLSQYDIDNFPNNYPECFDLYGNVSIRGNDISNFDGLNQISSINGSIYIEENPMLLNITGLNNMNYIGANLSIISNSNLSSLIGLNSLNNIGSSCKIAANNNLLNLNGLDSLKSIGGFLQIYNNSSITDINSLYSLNTLGGDLEFKYNPNINSISGLNNIDPNSITKVTIAYNNSLSECDIASICAYLALSIGEIHIFSNSLGCNTIEQVETGCLTDINLYPNYYSKFKIYPNPMDEILNIKSHDSIIKYKLELKNLYGQLVKEEKNIQSLNHIINVADLITGVYFYSIIGGGEIIQQGKLLKK